jgi:D-alanyl-D-alanine carboxypeptidase
MSYSSLYILSDVSRDEEDSQMHQTPSQEDPREESQTQHSEHYSLPQRRRKPTASRLPSTFLYTDEHPEIPIVKRASRLLNMQDDRHSTPAKQKIQVHHQRKQDPSSVIPPQQYTPHRKLITVGGILLTIVLLILAVTTTFHQLSAKKIQEQTKSQDNNPMALHNIGINKSHQIAFIQQQSDHPAPPILATSAYLLDADTGAVLYASNPSLHQPMLSTTKLMTALVAIQIGDPNQNILINDTITNDINQLAADSSSMGIKKGEIYTLKDLLYGMLLVSGNDAAVAIADQLGGGNQQNFVDKMNQEAVKLGLLDTHYANPHGLLATGQFSSAHDLALLAKFSLKVPLIHTISSTREYDIPKNNMHDAHDMLNTNQFLWWYPGVDGGKTGWDTKTNFVQVISSIRNHRHLIGVVMHSVDWWTDMRDLMNWGFNTFDWISPHDVNASEPIPYAADWHYFDKDKKETTIPTSDQGRYYIYTGYSISGLIMAYFDTNGGLKTFGFPISQAKKLSESLLLQQFEHGIIRCDQNTKQCTKTKLFK